MAIQGAETTSPKARAWLTPVFLVVGLVILKFSVWDVLQAAKNHSDKVSLGMQGPFVGTMAVVLGVLGIVAAVTGRDLRTILQNGEGRSIKNLRPLGWVFVVGSLVLGFAVHFWLRTQLESLGYRF